MLSPYRRGQVPILPHGSGASRRGTGEGRRGTRPDHDSRDRGPHSAASRTRRSGSAASHCAATSSVTSTPRRPPRITSTGQSSSRQTVPQRHFATFSRDTVDRMRGHAFAHRHPAQHDGELSLAELGRQAHVPSPVVADHETAHTARVGKRVPIAYDDPARTPRNWPVKRTRCHHRREIAVVVFPPIALLGRVALPATTDVDDDDAAVAECVEEPRVLLGGLPHAGYDDDGRERRVVDVVVERMDPDAPVVREHGLRAQRVLAITSSPNWRRPSSAAENDPRPPECPAAQVTPISARSRGPRSGWRSCAAGWRRRSRGASKA